MARIFCYIPKHATFTCLRSAQSSASVLPAPCSTWPSRLKLRTLIGCITRPHDGLYHGYSNGTGHITEQRRNRGDGAISGVSGGPGRVPHGCTVSGAMQENDAAVCGRAEAPCFLSLFEHEYHCSVLCVYPLRSTSTGQLHSNCALLVFVLLIVAVSMYSSMQLEKRQKDDGNCWQRAGSTRQSLNASLKMAIMWA